MNYKALFMQIKSDFNDMSTEEVIRRIDEIIENVVLAARLGAEVARMCVEVLKGIRQGFQLGFMPHNITKEKLKRVVSVLGDLAKLETTSKENREFIDILVSAINALINNTKSIKSEYR